MFHLPLNQTLFYTCTDLPNLTYHDFYKIDIKFRMNVKYRILFLNKLNHYAVLETGPDINVFSMGSLVKVLCSAVQYRKQYLTCDSVKYRPDQLQMVS